MSAQNHATLYFTGGNIKFSSGHFTIFSATDREPLHGHNYTIDVVVTTTIDEPGITFDYRLFEEKLMTLCQQLNWRTLIAAKSPYLKIESDDQHYQVTFNAESMWLLKDDVVLMPLENITLEMLSQWFVDQIMQDKKFVAAYRIQKVSIKVFNGPHHAAESCGSERKCSESR